MHKHHRITNKNIVGMSIFIAISLWENARNKVKLVGYHKPLKMIA